MTFFFIYKIDFQNNNNNPQNSIIKRLRYKKHKNHVIDESEIWIICTRGSYHKGYLILYIFFLDFLIPIICGC